MIRIIVNPSSAKTSNLWKSIKRKIEELRIECDFVFTKKKKDATFLARESQEGGFKEIFIVGGDGTINEVINGLNLGGLSLGIIPTGCGNDFAKMLGIYSIEEGISSLRSSCRRLVDIGSVNGRYFINNLGIGIDAKVVYLQSKLRGIKNNLRYLISALEVLVTSQSFSLEIESDDFKFSGEVLGVSIGNGRFHGGIFALTPYARIDDGLLDICIIKKTARIRRFLNLNKVIKGRHLSLEEVQAFRAKNLSIYSQRPFLVHTDGELFEEPLNRLEINILDRDLQFYVP